MCPDVMKNNCNRRNENVIFNEFSVLHRKCLFEKFFMLNDVMGIISESCVNT